MQPLLTCHHLYREQHYPRVIPPGRSKEHTSKLMLCSFVKSCATNSFPVGSGHSVCSSSNKGSNRHSEKPGGPQKSWRALQLHQGAQREKTHPPNNPTGPQGCWASCYLQLSPGPRDQLASPVWGEATLQCWGCSEAGLAPLWLPSISSLMLGPIGQAAAAPGPFFLAVSHSSWDQHGPLLGCDLISLCKASCVTGGCSSRHFPAGRWSPGSFCPSLSSKG